MSEQAASNAGWVRPALLLMTPLSVALHLARPDWHVATFVVGCIAVLPLAGYMGEATEALAARAGSGLGGLLNASFGNAAELILAIAALRAGHVDVVKASLTGSILGNLLLILGLSFLVGGLKYPEQRFSARAAESAAGTMVLAVVGLFVPGLLHFTRHDLPDATMHRLSVAIAAVLLLLYVASLVFQLRTHPHVYESDEADTPDAQTPQEHPPLGRAIAVLVAATVGVAIVSEILVHALEGTTAALGLSPIFVGVMVLALVGNAAEHSTAILMARRNRMNLAISVALESSKQIALFAAPVLVLLSGFIGTPLSLEFSPLETAAVAMSVVLSTLLMLDGRSNWLEGAMLVGLYAILGIAFYFTP